MLPNTAGWCRFRPIRAWLGGRGARPTLLALALLTAGGYWLLWAPAYRLNERIEYADWLLAAWPWVGGGLAVVLRLVGGGGWWAGWRWARWRATRVAPCCWCGC